jgi:hypothetical protein
MHAFRKSAQPCPQNCGFPDKMAKVRDDLRKSESDSADRPVTLCSRRVLCSALPNGADKNNPWGKNIGRKRAE